MLGAELGVCAYIYTVHAYMYTVGTFTRDDHYLL